MAQHGLAQEMTLSINAVPASAAQLARGSSWRSAAGIAQQPVLPLWTPSSSSRSTLHAQEVVPQRSLHFLASSALVAAGVFGRRACSRSHGLPEGRRQLTRVCQRAEADGAGQDQVSLALSRRLGELAKLSDAEESQRWEKVGDCELLVPSGQFPWGVVFFLGGAVLGQYPKVCYDRLLRPLADRTGCCVLAVPYEVSTDHKELASKAQEQFSEALEIAAEKYGWDAARMPKFGLGHSLGSKLHVIRHCSEETAAKKEKLALMAFNNFSIADSLSLAKEALQAFQGGPTGGVAGAGMDAVFSFLEPMARRAAANAGIEFKPGPDEMEGIMQEAYSAPSTQMIIFNDDRLDCAEDLIDATAERSTPVSRKVLQGDHLTPVVFKIGDIAGAAMKGPAAAAAAKAASMGGNPAAESMGGFQVGDEQQLEDLLEALEGWLRPV
eukprot:TRINITY_DN91588_c0_g1_i1.p1 TRINITY_DN91588_c0_g1~~TRINITY_DN91588_c0_g1_i1.p1  ORF type:complete len:474 (+),score=103.74 TRINITY_DN91588_c0_g1_i1:107-1423(+)